jgi:hypothetical protein
VKATANGLVPDLASILDLARAEASGSSSRRRTTAARRS